ncbi:conserved hypothetical protein [Trichinella spiralis]|uniref:hypothetical protein n=1 Tax=Trichinella spiralis TaxID=6334 RepID=UPI0001EFCF62|nr:conserved hypothetical protein [Trichinella spiralis]
MSINTTSHHDTLKEFRFAPTNKALRTITNEILTGVNTYKIYGQSNVERHAFEEYSGSTPMTKLQTDTINFGIIFLFFMLRQTIKVNICIVTTVDYNCTCTSCRHFCRTSTVGDTKSEAGDCVWCGCYSFVSQRTNISQYTKGDATRSSAQIIMINTGCK